MTQYNFVALDAFFYDTWIKYDFNKKSDKEIVIVFQNDETDQYLGESYPYTFATHDRFIQNLLKDDPFSVLYLTRFEDKVKVAEESYLRSFKKSIFNFRENGGKFGIGLGVEHFQLNQLPSELKDFGSRISIINIDNISFAKDSVTRRAILNYAGTDTIHLWAANEYLSSKGKKALSSSRIWGSYYSREADADYVLYKFFDDPRLEKEKIKSLSFDRVLSENFKKNTFKDKIVLIGPRYTSRANIDFLQTPFDKEHKTASRLNIHAQIISALIHNATVKRLPNITTQILSVLVALLLSLLITKVKPTKGLGITVVCMVFFVAFSYLLFSVFGIWLNITHVVLTIFVVYYIGVPFRAIAEYQQRFTIEKEANLLKKVDDLKRNFISLMSHDLKTPVAKIQSIADLLKSHYNPKPETRSHLENIIRSTKDLNKFITSILELTKVESSNLNLNFQSKDLNQIVEEVVENLKYESRQKNTIVESELSPLYPVKMDSHLITRVISNLLENAIKYSPESSKVELKTWDDDDWVYLSVEDNGPGISSENLENIFEKFYRVSNDSKHKIKGSGLGLFLVKYFIELHGGSIKVQSVVEQGTKFTVQLKNA